MSSNGYSTIFPLPQPRVEVHLFYRARKTVLRTVCVNSARTF